MPVWTQGQSVVEDSLYREQSAGFGSGRSEFQFSFATLGNLFILTDSKFPDNKWYMKPDNNNKWYTKHKDS